MHRIVEFSNYLNSKYPIYKSLNGNQKAALVSFSYNLGKFFIPNNTVKLKAALEKGDIKTIAKEMRDCDNTTINGKLTKVKGLTNRRNAEINLFNTK